MPTENRSSSNHATRTFTLDSLTAALEQVQAFHEISADLIAENVFGQPAQQGQDKPVALPARRQWNGLGNAADTLKASGWNACLDKIAELGPLYQRTDAELIALLERDRRAHCGAIHAQAGELAELRAQLAEAQAKGELLDDARVQAEEKQWVTERKLAEAQALLREWIDADFSFSSVTLNNLRCKTDYLLDTAASAKPSPLKCEGNH